MLVTPVILILPFSVPRIFNNATLQEESESRQKRKELCKSESVLTLRCGGVNNLPHFYQKFILIYM